MKLAAKVKAGTESLEQACKEARGREATSRAAAEREAPSRTKTTG